MFTNVSGAMAVPEIANKVLAYIRADAECGESFIDWWAGLDDTCKVNDKSVDVNVYSGCYSDDDHYHVELYACHENEDGTYSTDVLDKVGSAVVLREHAKEFLGIETD